MWSGCESARLRSQRSEAQFLEVEEPSNWVDNGFQNEYKAIVLESIKFVSARFLEDRGLFLNRPMHYSKRKKYHNMYIEKIFHRYVTFHALSNYIL